MRETPVEIHLAGIGLETLPGLDALEFLRPENLDEFLAVEDLEDVVVPPLLLGDRLPVYAGIEEHRLIVDVRLEVELGARGVEGRIIRHLGLVFARQRCHEVFDRLRTGRQ